MARALSRRSECSGPIGRVVATGMNKISYAGYRFPPEIIHQAIWLYLRFTLSLRDVEDLLAERAIGFPTAIRRPFRAADRLRLARKHRPRPHSAWHLDEVYLKIDGRLVTCGAPSTPKARCSMCWSRPSATSMPR